MDGIAPVVTGVWQLTVIKAREKLFSVATLVKEGKQSIQSLSFNASKQEVYYLVPKRYWNPHASL